MAGPAPTIAPSICGGSGLAAPLTGPDASAPAPPAGARWVTYNGNQVTYGGQRVYTYL